MKRTATTIAATLMYNIDIVKFITYIATLIKNNLIATLNNSIIIVTFINVVLIVSLIRRVLTHAYKYYISNVRQTMDDLSQTMRKGKHSQTWKQFIELT